MKKMLMQAFLSLALSNYPTYILSMQAVKLAEKTDTVAVISCDDIKFELPRDLITEALTIKDMLQDSPGEGVLPLPEIDSITFSRIKAFLSQRTLDSTINLYETIQLLRASEYLNLASLHDAALLMLVEKLKNPDIDTENILTEILTSPGLNKNVRIEIARAYVRSYREPGIISPMDRSETPTQILLNRLGKANLQFKKITSRPEPPFTMKFFKSMYEKLAIDSEIRLALILQLIENNDALLSRIVGIGPVLDARLDTNFQASRVTTLYSIVIFPEHTACLVIIKKLLGEEEFNKLVNSAKKEYPSNEFSKNGVFDKWYWFQEADNPYSSTRWVW